MGSDQSTVPYEKVFNIFESRIETTGMGCCQINESEIVIFGGFYEERLDNSKS